MVCWCFDGAGSGIMENANGGTFASNTDKLMTQKKKPGGKIRSYPARLIRYENGPALTPAGKPAAAWRYFLKSTASPFAIVFLLF